MIECKNVSLSMNKKTILDSISLSIKEENISVFLGPNGSGKTSFFLSMLDLYKKRYTGQLLIDGKNSIDMTSMEMARAVAFNFQFKRKIDSYVIDLLYLARNPYSIHKNKDLDEKCIQYAVKLTHIEDLLNRNMNTLSGGEKQMVYIAMTIIQDAKYMIFDEPDTYLDVGNKKLVYDIIKELKKKGKGIILSMHDFTAAYSLADTFYVFEKGNLVGSFTKEEREENTLVEQVFMVKKNKIKEDNEEFYIFH